MLTLDEEIAGYAYLDPPGEQDEDVSGELVIHPRHRRQGLGLALVRELIARADGHVAPALGARRPARGRRRWPGQPDSSVSARCGRCAGRCATRWTSLLSRTAARCAPSAPAATSRSGCSLNARAFAQHPEQGGWTRHDLELREQEPWFDPAGFFIAEQDGRHDRLSTGPRCTRRMSRRRTSVRSTSSASTPAEQGTGLGRALTLAGLHHLRERGLAEAMLYVDEDNVPAIRLYEALGFSR